MIAGREVATKVWGGLLWRESILGHRSRPCEQNAPRSWSRAYIGDVLVGGGGPRSTPREAGRRAGGLPALVCRPSAVSWLAQVGVALLEG